MNIETDLAILLANNWFFHDQEKYNKIKINSIYLLKKIGYEKSMSEEASIKIKNIFELADKAEEYQKKGQKKKEKKLYNLIKIRADKLDKILNRKLNSRYEIMWWETIRHKKYMHSIIFLFLDQVKKFGIKNLFSSIKSTYYLAKAGFLHDKKDWEGVKRYLVNYWKEVHKCKLENFLEF